MQIRPQKIARRHASSGVSHVNVNGDVWPLEDIWASRLTITSRIWAVPNLVSGWNRIVVGQIGEAWLAMVSLQLAW